MLLTVGFALLLTLYFIYAHYLGGIDGLPPLPEEYLPSDSHIDLPPYRPNFVDERLTMAFGQECPEIRRPIRLEIHSKRVLLSTEDFHIIRDRVRKGQAQF